MLLGDVIEGVATDTGQPKAVVEAIVRGVLARIEGAVGKGDTVNLVGFGRFEVYERSARRGRNLQTGESLKIPATNAVRFKVGKRLRDAAAGSKRKRAGRRISVAGDGSAILSGSNPAGPPDAQRPSVGSWRLQP